MERELERKVEVPLVINEKILGAGGNNLPNPEDAYREIQLAGFRSITIYVDEMRNLKLIDTESAYRLKLIDENKYIANSNDYFVISDGTIRNLESKGYRINYQPWVFYANDEINEYDKKIDSNTNDIQKLTELKEQLLNQSVEKPNQGFVK